MEGDKEKPVTENEAIEEVEFIQNKDFEANEEKPVEYFCGIGKWNPKCLQVFRDAKFFTFLLCCNCFIEGALASGFISVVLSSLERRYQLTGTQVGLIASVFDMAVIVTVLFISYFGGKGHKPRWMGVSLLIQGLGCIIFALPEFVFGVYETDPSFRLESCLEFFLRLAGMGNNQMMNDAVDDNTTTGNTSMMVPEIPPCIIENRNSLSLIFFYIGNIVIGVGAAALFTIGPAYIDEIVRPKFVSIHLGIFFMWSILGPALGFGVGAGFLTVYVDPWKETFLDPSQPGWVGAWWLCFFFAAAISWIIAIPFLMFPRLLPDSHLVKAERDKEMARKYGRDMSKEDKNFCTKLASLPRHLLLIITTPSWIFITMAISFSAFFVTGVTAFAPKYYESQFSLTAATASLIAGAVGIPTGAVGVVVGALIIYFTKSKGRNVALVNWIVTLLAMPPLLVFLIQCPSTVLGGVTVPYAPDGFKLPLPAGPITPQCSINCRCVSEIYEPVCGADGITHFSPCRAGCNKGFINNDPMRPVFENCTCIAANLEQMSNMTFDREDLLRNSTATVGACNQGCNNLGLFAGLSVIALFVLFILQVPNVFITIRCVAEEQRTLALGLQSLIFRIFGNVPGPIVFGVIFDLACVHFRFNIPCRRRGNCWVYNNAQLSHSILAMVLIGIGANFIFSFLSWLTYPKQRPEPKYPVTNTIPLEEVAEEEEQN